MDCRWYILHLPIFNGNEPSRIEHKSSWRSLSPHPTLESRFLLLLIRRATPGPALWLRLRLCSFSFGLLLLAKLVDLVDEDPEGRARVILKGNGFSEMQSISIYLSIYLPIYLFICACGHQMFKCIYMYVIMYVHTCTSRVQCQETH
jgi:hypothetical protein